MNRYIVTAIYVLLIVFTASISRIRVFDMGVTRIARESVFQNLPLDKPDTSLAILNIGTLSPEALEEKLDELLAFKPVKVGINACHFQTFPERIIRKYETTDNVIFSRCDEGYGSLSRIIEEGNLVTHFKTDRTDYFEFLLADSKGRGNKVERIFYHKTRPHSFFRGELDELDKWSESFLNNHIVLVGYLGDYLMDSVYYHKDCRITPLNSELEQEERLPDMYDTMISAEILTMIMSSQFLDEASVFVNVLIMFGFVLVNVLLLTFARTRWLIVNLVLFTLYFIVLTLLAGVLIFTLFFKYSYYLSLDALPWMLLIGTLFTLALNPPWNK